MMLNEHDSTYPNCHVITRVVYVGARDPFELLEDLKGHSVELNEFGIKLLSSRSFKVSEKRHPLVTVELSVHNLGYPQGATISEIYERVTTLGLSLCPIELGPHLRLQYLDQPEGFWGKPSSQHRAPPGSITIASEPLREEDDFPKGLYLRRIKGVPWLRGYQSGPEHIWGPDDHFIFCKP
ncbi:MAG: helicase [Anaerolineales bacterium]